MHYIVLVFVLIVSLVSNIAFADDPVASGDEQAVVALEPTAGEPVDFTDVLFPAWTPGAEPRTLRGGLTKIGCAGLYEEAPNDEHGLVAVTHCQEILRDQSKDLKFMLAFELQESRSHTPGEMALLDRIVSDFLLTYDPSSRKESVLLSRLAYSIYHQPSSLERVTIYRLLAYNLEVALTNENEGVAVDSIVYGLVITDFVLYMDGRRADTFRMDFCDELRKRVEHNPANVALQHLRTDEFPYCWDFGWMR